MWSTSRHLAESTVLTEDKDVDSLAQESKEREKGLGSRFKP